MSFDPERDDWPSVPDHCQECQCDLFPEERESGMCARCTADYEANRGADDAYERHRDDAA